MNVTNTWYHCANGNHNRLYCNTGSLHRCLPYPNHYLIPADQYLPVYRVLEYTASQTADTVTPHTHTPTAQVHKRPWVRWRRWEYREYNYILTATWYKHYTPPLFQLVLHIDHWTSQRTVSWCEYCAAKLGAESRELTDDSYVRVYGIIYVCLSICGIHTHTHWLHVCTGIWGLLINTPSDILCMLNECRKSLVYCTYM